MTTGKRLSEEYAELLKAFRNRAKSIRDWCAEHKAEEWAPMAQFEASLKEADDWDRAADAIERLSEQQGGKMTIDHRADCQLYTVPTYGLCTCDFDIRKQASTEATPARMDVEAMREAAAVEAESYQYPEYSSTAETRIMGRVSSQIAKAIRALPLPVSAEGSAK